MEKVVYHGSPKGDIEKLTAHKSTHQKNCIYATDNKVIAFLFMGKGNGDLDTRIGTSNGNLELVERRPGVLESMYNKEGYLYELDGSTFDHYDYLWSQEVISFEEEIIPLNKTYYASILDELNKAEQEELITIYRYPNRPDSMPLDNSDLIEKYISFEEQGLKGSVSRLLSIYPEFTDQVEKIMNEKSNSGLKR